MGYHDSDEGQRSLPPDLILAISLRDFKGSGAVWVKAGLDDLYDGIDGSSRYSIFSLSQRGSDSESFWSLSSSQPSTSWER